jgi:septal ring factor EnvC (AmiA/AmiB activator)
LVPGVWFLRHNQEHANAEFDATRRSLDVAQHQLKVLRADLSWLRQDLGAVKGQVRQSTTALSTYTAQFHQAQAALARVRSQLSTQGTDVAALQSCLGGVEQALNALSVGDGESAVGALRAVSSSCESALGSDG